jgi:ribonuclease HII
MPQGVLLCGLDEAGRGPLAGPVCAACVILPVDFPLELLGDSKKLKESQREEARQVILQKAAAWGIGWASELEIDEINILQASLLAMKRAFYEMIKPEKQRRTFTEALLPDGSAAGPLPVKPALGVLRQASGQAPGEFPPAELPQELRGLTAIVDGRQTADLPVPTTALVKADAQVPEVMAASILAKTSRDRVMITYSRLYPGYGYEKHKGYPTSEHYRRIAELGPSPIQRMSFRWQ